ncbi:MAG: NfeD family protein, partial [Puniceicoccales bacterium]
MKRKTSWLAALGALFIALAALPLGAEPDEETAPVAEATEAEEPATALPTAEAPVAESLPDPDTAQPVADPSPHAPDRVIPETPEGGWDVYVVPIEGAITSPQLYILRRALKEAIKNDVEIVLLDMDTPGGALNVTLEMMEALDKFAGDTITFVNDEAISAGSYISIATDDIWFSPSGIMGAAAVVSGGGQEVDESMKQKIDSYLRAKVRVLSKEYRYRADVQRAMMDAGYELEIDGQVIKEKDELLSLTADEATAQYGNPPQPLLAQGIAESIEDLLNQKLGAGNYQIREFEVSWSEEFAKWFKTFAPALLGIGMLLLFIEMKTPSFGLIGMGGICLLLLVFASNYFAGMAGNEPVILFIIGVMLIGVEIFLVPGTLLAGMLGAALVFGSLLWAMADIWPEGSEGFEITPMLFYKPVGQLALGFVITGIGIFLALKFLPKTWLYKSIILGAEVGDPSPVLAGGGRSVDESRGGGLPEPGSRGVVVT